MMDLRVFTEPFAEIGPADSLQEQLVLAFQTIFQLPQATAQKFLYSGHRAHRLPGRVFGYFQCRLIEFERRNDLVHNTEFRSLFCGDIFV